MGVATAGTESVEGRTEMGKMVGIAESATGHGNGGESERRRRFFPMPVESVGSVTSGPGRGDTGAGGGENSSARSGAGETGEHFVGPPQRVGRGGAAFPFGRGLVGDTINDSAPGDMTNVDSKIFLRARLRGDVREHASEGIDRIDALAVLAPGMGGAALDGEFPCAAAFS